MVCRPAQRAALLSTLLPVLIALGAGGGVARGESYHAVAPGDGLCRIPVRQLRRAGLPAGSVPAARLRVFAGTRQLPLLALRGGGGLRAAGESLRPGDELVVRVPPGSSASDWALGDRRHLRVALEPESQQASPAHLMDGPGEATPRHADPVRWRRRLRFEERRCAELLAPMRHDQDPWLWHRLMSVRDASTFDTVLAAPGAVAAEGALELTLFSTRAQAGARLRVELAGQELGVVDCAAPGWTTGTLLVPGELLGVSELPLQLELLTEPGAQVIIALDAVELEYLSEPEAHQDRLAIPLAALQGEALRADGFGCRSVLPRIEDPAGSCRWLPPLRGQKGRRGYAVRLPTTGLEPPDGVLVLQGLDVVPEAEVGALPPLPRVDAGASGQPILLVAGPPELVEGLAQLTEQRRREGWQVVLLDPILAYAHHGQGSEDPDSIRRCVAELLVPAIDREAQGEAGRLPHLLLAGPASYDPSRHLAPAESKHAAALVPSFYVTSARMVAGSDTPYADLDQDGVLDLPVARLPAVSAGEVAGYARRVLRYATGGESPVLRRALLLSDRLDPESSRDFAQVGRELGARLPATVEVLPVGWVAGGDRAGWQGKLREALPACELVTYVGHGSITAWGSDALLRAEEVGGLWGGSAPATPMVLAVGCLSAYHVHPSVRSLAEAFLFAPRGGALLYIGSTTMAGAAPTFEAAGLLLDELGQGGSHQRTVGEQILAARRRFPGAVAAGPQATLVVLGDPTLPALSPP